MPACRHCAIEYDIDQGTSDGFCEKTHRAKDGSMLQADRRTDWSSIKLKAAIIRDNWSEVNLQARRRSDWRTEAFSLPEVAVPDLLVNAKATMRE